MTATLTIAHLDSRAAWLARRLRATTCPVERTIIEARGLLARRYTWRKMGFAAGAFAAPHVFGRPISFEGVSR